jgi:hypothetical protein
LSLQDTVVIVVVCHSNHFTQNTQQQKHRIAKYTLLINNHYYIHQSNYIATLSFYHNHNFLDYYDYQLGADICVTLVAKGNFIVIKKHDFGNFRYFGVFFGNF